MTNSIRRARKFSRSGVAAASVVSLALGAFSVVGPGPLASAAEEEAGEDTSLTGGIRGTDGSGVINASNQLESDLDAGSCMIQSAPGSEDGSQGGFSWVKVEPSKNTSDKRTWGVSVAFDNSQDRTFAYWEWSSSSVRTAPVTFGSVPAAPAGVDLGPNITASDQANEELGITNGSQITYGLKSNLSEEEVEKFAQAGADSPVRYVWKTQYTKDNETGIQATPQSSFIALVNPWPSENDQCSPIKVDWVGIQQHVIVPGEETKVGHINVPALSDGSVDDSLSRMVVEAYDGNGKYIASSDTGASNGGKQLLRVEDNGDIYYTWPEYRGTDLAADKNVQFSVVAKPRTTGQLEEASATDPWYGPDTKVFDSSNSLPRYSKANEIGRNTISLDDTEFHDPQYNTDEQTITSGIDKDGNLTDQPQEVVFAQVPDLIRDLVKEKGNGGFEAKVVLDQRYVFAGWTAELDEDYNVTVTAPADAEPGTFAQPRVVVEYSNGSKDELSLLVIVDPNHTQITDLVRPAVAKGEVNTDITAQITTKSIMNGYDPVSPATFKVDQSTVPAGWTVTVDNTGKVTAKADDTVAPGTIITPKVTAKYPDGTADEVEPQFQAIVDIKIPDYDTVTNKPGTGVSLTPKVPEVGLTGNASDEAPERYTFEDGETEKTVKDAAGEWKLTINEKTGEITTTIPRTAPEGHILEIPVLAHYSDESDNKPQRVKGTVVVLKGDIAPVYSVESTGPNQAVDHQVQDAPEGSTFSFGKKPDGSPLTEMTTEDGWKYTIDPKTGVVTSTPPAGSKPGDKKTITVDVATPTGDTPKVPVTTVVKLTNNWEAEPNYPVETVYPGEAATSPITVQAPEGVSVAKDTPFAINPEGLVPTGENNEHGNPTYKVATANGEWVVGLDDKGNVISLAPDTAKPGDQIQIPVIVTYEDGSKDTVSATINVVDTPKREVPFKVVYKYDATVNQGTYRVETKGEPGTEKQKKNGSWERTQKPVDEVVVIGTKPMGEKVEWKVPIPYSTIVRENPELAPGETRVVQDGSNGEASYAAIFNGVNGESSVTETTARTEPKDRIVEYGPRLKDQDLVTETTRKIPFDTKVVFDDTLEAGEQVVDTQGVVGEEKVTSTQKLVDGKPSGDPVVTTKTTTEKQDAVIRVGTKTEGQTTETVEAEVPFGVKVVFDPNMPAGTSETVTEGKAGKKTITVTRKVTNSQPVGEATVEEKITEEPVNQVIKVGTKPSEASSKVTWTAQVPFEVETRPNSELKPGEIRVAQKGVPGEKTYTADFAATGTDATVTPEEKQTKDPVKEIIEYGPRLEDQNLVTTVKKPVPFETEIVFDDTLASGTQEVKQYGRVGEDTVTSTQKLVDGQPSGDPVVETTRTEEPIKQIIRVGTKTTGTNTETITTEAPYKVVVKYDPNMPAGTSEVTTPGVPGEKTVTITRDINNSTPGKPTITEEITKQPVNEVITVGTKQATATDSVQWTEPIPFGTTLRPNPELKPGETRVVQEGKNGEASYVAVFTGTNGEATVKETKARTEPVERIVEYGPRAEDTSVVTKTEKPVPFETEIVFDDTLVAGQQVVDKQGELGTEVVTSTQDIVDGKPTGEPTVTTERTKEPVNAVIRVGTKTDGTNAFEYKEPVPFETKVEYDPTLAAGEYKVETPGKAGEKTVAVTQTIVNSKITETKREENVTTQPVTQVIKVGTKQATATDKVEWKEPIPFSTVVRPNPELKPGEIKVAQKGVPGEKTYTADFTAKGDQATVTPEEKQTKDPVTQIIEYGPAAEDTSVVTKTEKPVPFETEIVFDDTLAEGEQVVDQQGEHGSEVVTSTQQIVDGKPSGDPTVTTERTKEPVKQIIRVGTKTAGQTVNTYEAAIPFPVRVVYDPNLAPGESKVTQEGKPGTKKITITQPVVNSAPNGEATVAEETVTEPTEQIVTVGTKPDEATNTVTWTVDVPFKTVVRANPELKPGDIKTVQEGEYGEKKFTADFSSVGADSKVDTKEEQTKEPKDQIIEYGPTIDDQTLTSTTTNPVPFNTTFVADPNLPVGEQVVDKQGENGVDTVTSTQEIKDGKPVGEPKISTERTKEPVNAVVRVGTKTDSTNDFEYKEPVPYETKIEYDPTLAAGEYQVVTPGKAGEKTVKVTETIVNSKVTDTERDEEITTQPVTQVIKVGTKQPTAGEQVTWTEPIPFQTTFRENPDLAPGETKVVQEGKDGEATYYVEFNSNGESATVENTNQRVEPVERIVEYGPRANGDEISSQVTRPVEFKTSVIYDDTLEEGKQVITQGELGEEVVTTTQKLVDGKPSGEPVRTTEVTKTPVNAVIRIGTKKPGTPDPAPEVSEVVDLPFTTKIVYDPTLEPGQEIEDVTGANGQVKVTVVNGKATVETVKEPVQRVVRVGTKPAGDVEWTEEIPFKVQVRENPELTREQSRIIQEGVPGLKQVVNGNEQVVREPVDYILEVGTKVTDEKPQYSPVALQPGQTADIQPANGVKGNKYRKLDWPEGWEGTVDPETGQVHVTTPADAKPGAKAKLPIEVTDENGNTYTVYTEVIVSGKDVVPAPDTKTSSDKAKRCVSNAFAKNSPILWMLPVALLGAVGYGVNEAFGPQIQRATAQINEQIRRSMPDFGIGHGVRQPEWVREINAQVDAINRQFAPVAKQLEPVGIALGVIAALSLTGVLIAQACTEEGFDNGLTIFNPKDGEAGSSRNQ